MRAIKTYSELTSLSTFEERFRYIKLDGVVGRTTFGSDRIFNQKFYVSEEWRHIRRQIILRDNGCNLGIPGMELGDIIIVHHMNPIMLSDIMYATDFLTQAEYLICMSPEVHRAIHYGDDSILYQYQFVERRPNDTCPWKV